MTTDAPRPDEPLDEADLRILDDLAELWTALDPVPEDLTLEIRFRLSVRELDAEIAQLQHAADDPAPARARRDLAGTGAFRDTPVRTDTLTFSCDRLSCMITVDAPGSERGMVRLDGWVTEARCEIELQVLTRDRADTAVQRTIRADADGRFTAEEVPTGPARLLFRHPRGTVLTPYFDL